MLLLGLKILIGLILFFLIIHLILYFNKEYTSAHNTQIRENFTLQSPIQSSLDEVSNHTTYPLPQQTIRFLNPTAMNIFEFSDDYLISMNSANINARQLTTAGLHNKYKSSILVISEDEKQSFNNFIQLINTKLDASKESNATRCKKFINYILIQKTIIAKSATWLESGMPHTHQNIIILSQQWFNEITNTTTLTNNTKILENGGTLSHEIIHILQRIYPEKFKKLYEKWGFIHASYIDNFSNIEDHNRINPDGRDIKWIWRTPSASQFVSTYYWFGALFRNESPTRLSDVEYVIYPVYEIDGKNKKFKLMENGSIHHQLSDSKEHKTYFNITNNHYHPNEIVAEYFSIWFKKMCGLHEGLNVEAYSLFESWILAELL